jgi:hypothetical protein
MTKLTFALNLIATFAGIGLVFVSAAKRGLPEGSPPFMPYNVLAAVLYLPYVGPNIPGALPSSGSSPTTWYALMNDAVTGLSVVKTLVDNLSPLASNTNWNDYFSPVFESIINVAWMAPAIGGMFYPPPPTSTGWVGFASNMAFDIGGAATPGTLKSFYPGQPDGPIIAEAFFAATIALALTYSVFCVTYGGLKLAGK